MSNGQQPNGYNNSQQQNQWNGYNQQQNTNIQNGYHNMTNPAAAFQAMQQGSQYGSFIGMQQAQIGSNRNLAAMGQQPSMAYKQPLTNQQCMSQLYIAHLRMII